MLTKEEIREILSESPFRFLFHEDEIEDEIEKMVEQIYNRYVLGMSIQEEDARIYIGQGRIHTDYINQ